MGLLASLPKWETSKLGTCGAATVETIAVGAGLYERNGRVFSGRKVGEMDI